MSTNGKGLGRGLDALFQDSSAQNEKQPDTGMDKSFLTVSPDALAPNPGQPREKFGEEKLQELAASIKEKGILQPLLVRPANQPGTFQIIAGERRWRAAQLAGLDEIPVIVRELDDTETMIAALMENIQREDLNPVELAKALSALQKLLGINQDALAEKLGKQRGTISNQMRILRLSPEAQEDLVQGRITVGHARAIVALPPGEHSEELRRHIIETQMTVREAEEATAFWREHDCFPWQITGHESDTPEKTRRDPAIKTLAEQIGATLNCRTRISGNSEKGHISLSYDSNEQLYELLEKLGLSLSS